MGGRIRISRVVFWLFLAVSVGALACGWAAAHAAPDEARLRYFYELHQSLAFAGLGLILVQLVAAAVSLAFRGPMGAGSWLGGLSFALRQLAYLSFLALVVTGAGGAALRGERISFFDLSCLISSALTRLFPTFCKARTLLAPMSWPGPFSRT